MKKQINIDSYLTPHIHKNKIQLDCRAKPENETTKFNLGDCIVKYIYDLGVDAMPW